MYSLLRNILFLLPAEKAHYFTLNSFKWILRIPGKKWFLKKNIQSRSQGQ
jgi:hypothetical protein